MGEIEDTPTETYQSLQRGSAVANDLFDFIFLFAIDKVRGWRWEVLAVNFIFRDREIRGKHGRLGGSSRSLVGGVDK